MTEDHRRVRELRHSMWMVRAAARAATVSVNEAARRIAKAFQLPTYYTNRPDWKDEHEFPSLWAALAFMYPSEYQPAIRDTMQAHLWRVWNRTRPASMTFEWDNGARAGVLNVRAYDCED